MRRSKETLCILLTHQNEEILMDSNEMCPNGKRAAVLGETENIKLFPICSLLFVPKNILLVIPYH